MPAPRLPDDTGDMAAGPVTPAARADLTPAERQAVALLATHDAAPIALASLALDEGLFSDPTPAKER